MISIPSYFPSLMPDRISNTEGRVNILLKCVMLNIDCNYKNNSGYYSSSSEMNIAYVKCKRNTFF
jgi:hypothetical protein